MGVLSIHPFIRGSPFGGDAADMSVELTPLGRKVIQEMERNGGTGCESPISMDYLRPLSRRKSRQRLRASSSGLGIMS